MSPITTHVLDTARGRPAAGVVVLLEHNVDGAWKLLGRGMTDDDGRIRTLLPPAPALPAGHYRLTFDTGAYFAAQGVPAFYRSVPIQFDVAASPMGTAGTSTPHVHVPLLLSPFGYSTYRGS